MNEIKRAVEVVCQKLFGEVPEVLLTRPDEKFGDYATNVALQLAAKTGKKPRDVAGAIAGELKHVRIAKIDVAGPGFINITLTDEAIAAELSKVNEKYGQNDFYKDRSVVAEFSDPNPFKVLHAGHLYTSVVGDSISRLFEAAGAQMHRVNFGGDVGLHVAKTCWAIIRELGGENPDKLADIAENQRAEWMSQRYVEGNSVYENDENAKSEIVALNKQIYKLVAEMDKKSALAQIYWTCRQWSYDYFDDFYEKLGVKFDRYYPESETVDIGLKAVNEQLAKGVFKKSDGAIIYDGEVHNLHTRVFINSEGLPTYETKDVGLILKKWQDYKFDTSLVITGNEIYDYMQVVLKAVEQFEPELVKRTVHLTHGMVRLKGGAKMSSRAGNILKAVDIIEATAETNQKQSGKDQPQIVLGALKYAFLKHRIGGDIIFDPKESVSLEGNSGPYLQYAHARARSILRKAKAKTGLIKDLQTGERSLARKLTEYPDVVLDAVKEHLPSHVCSYLYELAAVFNRFYESNRVIGDPREAVRLQLVSAYSQVLKNGLGLLGIAAPEKM